MIHTLTEVDRLIELAIIQRSELKKLVDSLPELRTHLSIEIEKNVEQIEPHLRAELEVFLLARAKDENAKLGELLESKIETLCDSLEITTAAKYSALSAYKENVLNIEKIAEKKIADAGDRIALEVPAQVDKLVSEKLANFPRATQLDQLRKEFAEPASLNPRGKWQVGETYYKLDLVSVNGSSYIANETTTDRPSSSSPFWTLSASRGNGGGGNGGVTSLTDLVPVPNNGELLIGNGSGFVESTLTAGSGISITNGAGSITVTATGGVQFQGSWNASTNTPALTSSVGTTGYFYIVSVAGSTNLNGITDWEIGDWAIFSTSTWTKVDNTDKVSSVFGRVGSVVGVSTDYSAVGITNTALGASNPSTVAATTITASSTITATGAVTGSNLSGTNTGDQTNITGNAGTATALQTARNINGVSFNGTANITVTAAGSTLSDTVPITKGGTGQITAQAALNALLPSQSGAAGKNLQSDGTNVSFVADAGGTVTSVAVTTANGVSGSVANSTTTPAISLTLGAITPTSVNSVVVSGSSTPTLAVTGTTTVSGSNTGDQTTISGNAGTATKLATGRTIAVTGDLAYTSPSFDGSANVTAAGTLATVATAGTTGGSTAIPVVTINAKGLTTSITTAAVVAPAGTLSGNTLASGVTASSLTSLGTIANLTATAGTISTAPSASTDIANKLYVDTVAQGLDAKASCIAATTADITLTGTQTIDGIAIVAGNRVLVKNQTLSQNNGIYLCAAGAWTRTTDADTWDELTSAFTFIETGTVNADTGWVCTANAGGTLGTTALPWSQFSGAGSYTASTGLTLTGTAFSLTTPVAVANGGTGITSFGSGIATFLGTPTSANLAAALTDETGSGANVFGTSPTITTPVIAQINDANGNETLKLASIASAVNEVTIENASTGNPVHIVATGGDASVGLHLAGKGASGYVNVQDSTDATKRIMFNAAGGTTNTRTMLSSTQTVDRTLSLPDATDTLVGRATTDTLTNKTLTSPTLTAPILGTPASGNLASCTGYVGTSALVTVGALNSGSITSGFGSIDVGADAISGGAISGSGLLKLNQATLTNPAEITDTIFHITAADGKQAISQYDSIGGAAPVLYLRRANGTSASPTAVLNGQGLGFIVGRGYGTTGYSANNVGQINFQASENWTDSAQGTEVRILATANGAIANSLSATFTATGLNSTAIGATTPSTVAATTISTTGNVTLGAGSDVFNGSFRISDNASSTASVYLQSGEPGTSVNNVILSNNYYGTNGGASGRRNTAIGASFVRLNAVSSVNSAAVIGVISDAGSMVNTAIFNSTGLAVTGALSNTTGANFATSSGNVGIGTTSPLRTLGIDGGLAFQTSGGASRAIHWMDTATSIASLLISGNAPSGFISFSTNTLGSAGLERMVINSAGAIRFNAYGAGALTTDASGNITAASDERIKKNIRPFSRGLSDIIAINPILHGYTEESGLDQSRDDYAGFSAQQVQPLIPEAIGVNADGMLSFSDRPIMAALVNAVKELSARLAALESK